MAEKFTNEPNEELKQSKFWREQLTPKGIHCEFFWKTQPQTWAGLTPTQLSEITQQLADFHHVATDDQRTTFVHFGDHQRFRHVDDDYESPKETDYLSNGVGIPDYINMGRGRFEVRRADIVFNRSLELFAHKAGKSVDKVLNLTSSYPDLEDTQGTLVITLQSAEEYLLWLMNEEMNHVAVNYKLEDEGSRVVASEKYRQLIESQVLGLTPRSPSPDLLEATASRQCLRFLSHWFSEKNPTRAKFFRETLQLSVKTRKAVAVRAAFNLTDLFVLTGYRA